MLQDQHISMIANSDGEHVVKQVIYKAAAKTNLPHAPAPVERHEASGRAEQKVRQVRPARGAASFGSKMHVLVALTFRSGMRLQLGSQTHGLGDESLGQVRR